MLLDRLSAGGGSLANQAEHVLEIALPARPQSAAIARAELRGYCQRRAVPSALAEEAVLVLSELVTNAVLHARTPFLAWAEYDQAELTVAVLDGDASLPTLFPLDEGEREGGRGVAIVDRLGGTWGLVRSSLGKIVWVRLVEGPSVPTPR